MTNQANASMISLLTRDQVCLELDLPPRSVDLLVETGQLSPVRVSAGTDLRFWPDEIMTYALRAALKADARASTGLVPTPEAAPTTRSQGPAPEHWGQAAARSGRRIRRPAWLPFTSPVQHAKRAYIAFADRDHLVSYLRQRSDAEAGMDSPSRPSLAGSAIRSIAAMRPPATLKAATIKG